MNSYEQLLLFSQLTKTKSRFQWKVVIVCPAVVVDCIECTGETFSSKTAQCIYCVYQQNHLGPSHAKPIFPKKNNFDMLLGLAIVQFIHFLHAFYVLFFLPFSLFVFASISIDELCCCLLDGKRLDIFVEPRDEKRNGDDNSC